MASRTACWAKSPPCRSSRAGHSQPPPAGPPDLPLRALRPGQEEAIRATAAGRDVLAVLPTGAAKSAIYQLAALIIPGPTVRNLDTTWDG